jgi:hypothetical protein
LILLDFEVPAPHPGDEAAPPREASSLRRLILQTPGSYRKVRMLNQVYEEPGRLAAPVLNH